MDVVAVDLAVVGAATAAGAFAFARRYGGGKALAELERANRILTNRVNELEVSDAAKTRRITELEARTDIAMALVPVLAALKDHENQAGTRSKAMLQVLGMIAERLGADPEAIPAAG